MANLPNKPFVFNYNARDYNPSTFTIPNESGATLDRDMVWTGTTSVINNITFDEDHITIPISGFSLFDFSTKFGPDSTGSTIAASGGTATTNLESETGWTATTTYPWITISPASGESGTTAITFTIKKNLFSARTGVVTFTSDAGDVAEYTITQEGQDKVAPINKMYQGARRIN